MIATHTKYTDARKNRKSNSFLNFTNISSKKIVFGLIAAFILTTFFIINNASAQQSNLNLTISPPVMELVAKPGEKITENFRIRNNGSEKIELNITARRLISDPQNGSPIPEDTASGEELKWVSFNKTSFTALPSEWTDISYTIDIPESAAHGYYYVFRIAPKSGDTSTVTGATVKGEILAVALLTVKKDGANTNTELINFKSNDFITEYLPANFTVTLKNRGNVHVKPRGNIFIKRGSGDEISILEVNSGLGSVLPGGMRDFEASWNEGFIVREPILKDDTVVLDDNGNPKTKININWNKLTDFRIGPYNAQLFMVYDDGTRDVTIEGSTTFWVIPYTALGIILVSIIVIIIILRFVLKWYIKKAIKSSRSR